MCRELWWVVGGRVRGRLGECSVVSEVAERWGGRRLGRRSGLSGRWPVVGAGVAGLRLVVRRLAATMSAARAAVMAVVMHAAGGQPSRMRAVAQEAVAGMARDQVVAEPGSSRVGDVKNMRVSSTRGRRRDRAG
ncbi:hypothetical protein GCM10009560_32680 [Nonomuraea longicatena]|uniref:Uncharacterized protein n=1 Tax=Nonomuraea longicatena TaxID=83682 RepID=A0ABN1PJC4_9ACTN